RGRGAERPAGPPPVAPPPRRRDERHRNSVMARMDMRRARARDLDELPGPPGDGRSAMWARIPGLDVAAAMLSVGGDLVPSGISQTHGRLAGGNSMDTTTP